MAVNLLSVFFGGTGIHSLSRKFDWTYIKNLETDKNWLNKNKHKNECYTNNIVILKKDINELHVL